MADRLSTLDASFLSLEDATTPMHVGSLSILQPPEEGFDHDALVALIEERVRLVPRFRQKVRTVPGHLANPVWVDDADFDVAYHVRRSALPRPGTRAQLLELVGRLQARRLDRSRPLWEMYLVEGLEGGRIAIISKTHHALVDGVEGVDLQTVILDIARQPRATVEDGWQPGPEPAAVELLAGAAADLVRRPLSAVDSARTAVADLRATAGRAVGTVGGLLAGARVVARQAPASPLNVAIGAQRRFGIADTSLDDYKRVRKTHGGTINDVVLATVAGALRTWLLTRGEPVSTATSIRAMVPVSVRSDAGGGQLGSRVTAYFVDLPVGEPNAVVRLSHVSHAMRGHQDSQESVGADTLVALSGFAPPTIHSLGARLASGLSRRAFNLVVTNVPGPQFPLYAAGARLLSGYPVVPLGRDQALSIGLTSYDGGVHYGLNADRDAMPDVDVLAALIEESLAELVGTVR